VVNLASRLQDMTRQLHASILVDEATSRTIRQANEARHRSRATDADNAAASPASSSLPAEGDAPTQTHHAAPLAADATPVTETAHEARPLAARVRRLARLRPYGMNVATEVSQLLPP